MEARFKNKAPIASDLPFQFELKLAGSRSLQFLPFGKKTNVSLHSNWQSPSFIGNYLPTRRDITPQGFSAHWEILHLARNYPQNWSDQEVTKEKYQESAFGAELLFPVDHYQEVTRSAKYGILFIALTFVTFFFFEIFSRLKVHPVQYLLVSFGLCLFYLLLLSLSEYLGFGVAYALAGAATVLLISGYSGTVLKTGRRAFAMGGILAGLYAYLYVLLQLTDFALLMGSIGLFGILTIIMFITRKVDWYSLNGGGKSAPHNA
jgi:inner membrane protein